MSQWEVAEELGVTKQAVQRTEKRAVRRLWRMQLPSWDRGGGRWRKAVRKP